jgi:D-alanyl-D-alanine dipeptidase
MDPLKYIIPLLIFFWFISCNQNTSEKPTTTPVDSVPPIDIYDTITDIKAESKEEEYIVDTLERKLISAGLIDIQTIIPSIWVDVKYSDTNNFMHRDVYGHLNKIYLQPSVAADLKKSQDYLKGIDSSLTLLVYDGVRPRSVQQYMWDNLDLPIHEKTKFVSNPKNGSLHNYGAAVDVTIADKHGDPLDMGAGYDDIRKIAYPRYEKQYVDSGLLSIEHINNRELLRAAMKAGGFWNIATEWWHFNRYNRDRAKELFEIVE